MDTYAINNTTEHILVSFGAYISTLVMLKVSFYHNMVYPRNMHTRVLPLMFSGYHPVYNDNDNESKNFIAM